MNPESRCSSFILSPMSYNERVMTDTFTTPLDSRPAIGIDLGGTHLRSALIGADGSITCLTREDTPRDRSRVIPRLQEIIDGLSSHGDVAAVGIAVPGAVENNVVTSNHLSWRGEQVAEQLRT